MNRSTLCHAIALACGTVALASTAPVGAVKVVSATAQVPLQIIGADSFCASWTVGTDATTGGATLTCVPVTSTGGSTAPTGCTATINGSASATLASSAGGTVNLAASCTSPTSGVTFAWTRNGVASSSSASWTDTLPANTSTTAASTTSYQGDACNGTACVTVPATPLTAIVPATTASGGGSTGGGGTTGSSWNGTCPGFANTRVLQMNWANPTRMYTSTVGSFGPNDALVVVFTTGSASSPSNNLPKIGGAEYGSPPSPRYAVLSATPCDFAAQAMPGGSASANTVTIPFAVGSGSNFGYYPTLLTNTTYYFNIKNGANPGCATIGNCDMFIDLLKPGGM